VVATTTEATRVAALVSETAPDLVLLDVRMPELDGLTCLTRLRRRFPGLVVVMMSGSEETGDPAAGARQWRRRVRPQAHRPA
jgi:CheY-like chemotaxis protein